MTTIDEIEELRAELRHCNLTADERRQAETRLDELLRARDDADQVKVAEAAIPVSTRNRG